MLKWLEKKLDERSRRIDHEKWVTTESSEHRRSLMQEQRNKARLLEWENRVRRLL